MAMTALAPAITRSKEIFAEKTSQVALKLVPDLSDGKQADRKFFAIFVSVIGGIGLMLLLLINTLLAQDAFELTSLKLEAKLVSDEREAIARQIDKLSSPEALAKSATDLGMKPSENPTFLSLDKPVLEEEEVIEVPVKNG
jgi:cell division protein FtsB